MKKRPQPMYGAAGRTLSRLLGRTGVLIVAWLTVTVAGTGVVVATGESQFAASEAVSGPGVFAGIPGVSNTVHATASVKQVGALFDGGLSGGHYCTASVVQSAGKNVVVTAAHCLSGGTGGTVFVPGYHDGEAPYGVWPLESVTLAPGWTSGADQDLDVAFAEVAPLNGREVQDVVGGYTIGTSGSGENDGTTATTVRITGYPSTADAPLTCYNDATAYTAEQLRIACTDYSGGTSGSPWVTGLDPDTGTGTIIGVIGGYEEGGDTPDVSYSPAFDSAIGSLYEQAVAAAA
ncbi:trypsin-like serine protease [Streptomyces sp. RKAG293]|uniref:trypsin-like serine peptidase n=1 Tax=Streptomyces sp. RKAG293 TaxID=2893403 RepID=UPI0020338C76|nr:trypsin-like serine protease [Streptomyces sp. RKAG293]MCM2423221.1 trypsin-like serine protease [Streptomyces sp. RKAG293]